MLCVSYSASVLIVLLGLLQPTIPSATACDTSIAEEAKSWPNVILTRQAWTMYNNYFTKQLHWTNTSITHFIVADTGVQEWFSGGGNSPFGLDVAKQYQTNALYITLPGMYCIADLLRAGEVNTILGDMLGMYLPLEFTHSIDDEAGDSVYVASANASGAIVNSWRVCNSIVYQLDSALSLPPVSDVDVDFLSTVDLSRLTHAFQNATDHCEDNQMYIRQRDLTPSSPIDMTQFAPPGFIPGGGQQPPSSGAAPAPAPAPLPAPGLTASQAFKGSSSDGDGSSNMGAIVGIAAGVGVLLLLLLVAAFIGWRFARKRKRKQQQDTLQTVKSGDSTLGRKNSTFENFFADDSMDKDVKSAEFVPLGLIKRGSSHNAVPPVLMSTHSGSGSRASSSIHSQTPLSGTSSNLQESLMDVEIDAKELTVAKTDGGEPEILGRGGFGVVYRGLRNGVQPVAIKVAMTDTHQPVNVREKAQLIKEIGHLRFCRDTNVVQFLGVAFNEQQVMLVTEFMPGGDLFKALTGHHKEKYMWSQRGPCIVMDIVRGLCYLHKNNIIHCDLKPHNVLLDARGTAKISDLGMSSNIMSKGYLTHASEMGTYAWAAPEMLMNHKITAKADVFSLGIILWQIVTGEVPKRGRMDHDMLRGNCPEVVEQLIEDCMCVAPEDRPTAKEVFYVLQKVTTNIWRVQGKRPSFAADLALP